MTGPDPNPDSDPAATSDPEPDSPPYDPDPDRQWSVRLPNGQRVEFMDPDPIYQFD